MPGWPRYSPHPGWPTPCTASPTSPPTTPARTPKLEAARRSLAECNQRLSRYRAALEAGTDPALIARWTAEVTAQRVMAQGPTPPDHRPRPDAQQRGRHHRHLGLKLNFKQQAHIVQVQAQPDLTD
jgi:hypothetical protein